LLTNRLNKANQSGLSQTVIIFVPKIPANGNYEPILVGLGLIIPLLAIGIKLSAKKQLNKSLVWDSRR